MFVFKFGKNYKLIILKILTGFKENFGRKLWCGWVELSKVILSSIIFSVVVTVSLAAVMVLPVVEVPGVAGVPL